MKMPWFVFLLFTMTMCVLFIVERLANIVLYQKGKFFYKTRIRFIFSSYITILVVSLILDIVNPPKGIHVVNRVLAQTIVSESFDLTQRALSGETDKIDPKFIVKKWSFHYGDQQFYLALETKQDLNTQIVVERKSTNDQQIEAVFYRTRTNINGIDVTNKIRPVQITLVGNRLTLLEPQAKINLSQYNNTFAIRHFTGEKKFDTSPGIIPGVTFLYIRIPKNLKIITPTYMKNITNVGNPNN